MLPTITAYFINMQDKDGWLSGKVKRLAAHQFLDGSIIGTYSYGYLFIKIKLNNIRSLYHILKVKSILESESSVECKSLVHHHNTKTAEVYIL